MHRMNTQLAKRFKERPVEPAAKALERAGVRATYYLHDRLLSNTSSRRRFRGEEPELDTRQRNVLEGLDERGLSMLPLTEVFDEPGLWERLREDARPFIESVEATLAEERAAQERGDGKRAKGKKDFVRRAISRGDELTTDNPWLALGISDRMLEIVNSYLGMWSKLSYVDLWYTVPASGDAERQSSQRWHRDYNDKHLVKVFVYLTDVDEGAGPFEYVLGSVGNGAYAGAWPWRPLGETYPPSEEFDQRVPESAILTLTGAAGTAIFCNTSGFHRGGFATRRPRVMAVYNYVSPASLESLCQRNFRVDDAKLPAGVSAAARFALS